MTVASMFAFGCGTDPRRPDDMASAAEVARSNPVEQSRGAAAAEATILLSRLAVTPDSAALRDRFLHLFNIVFVANGIEGEPLLQTAPVQMLTRAHQFARAGDAAFLEALMYAALGWYGTSAEGGEGLNEVLWENLAVVPQLTLNVLAQLPREVRAQLMARVYTAPVHDLFDFAAIVAGLRAASVPAGLEREVAQILSTARELIPK